jgi:deoxyribodipyrimidine photolyase-related protein
MIKNLLVLPNQLFIEEIKKLELERIYLYEHPEFFTKYNYNKKKILLHRASMKSFYYQLKDELKDEIEINYLNFTEDLVDIFKEVTSIKLYDPVNKNIRAEIVNSAFKNNLKLEIMESPNFLTSIDINIEYFEENNYYHFDYYKMQRKRLDILIDQNDNPEGGHWSFDSENRKKFPKNIEIPAIPIFKSDFIIEEAKNYVKENFANNPGNLKNFIYPINNNQAGKLFDWFLKNKLNNFGSYQDAIEENVEIGFHSLISSSLNIGLISPEMIVNKTINYYRNSENTSTASVEGFIRQIIGWREYVRALYELEGEEILNSDFWGHKRSFPKEFYQASTNIDVLDNSLSKAVNLAYNHHIERLMILGNFFLISEINEDEVYKWFMEMFIDAYEWVMVPNVYAMSQFAYTEMMTKPYISSSNYIRKMSHYQEGEWSKVWDALYWRFLDKNKNKLANFPRMNLMISILENMDASKLQSHIKTAEDFLEKINIK